jgi:streptogramin lyase
VSTPTPGATIHYTIDGMQPTKLSPALISGDTILITSNLTLKAFTERYGLADSDVVTAKYNLTASLGFSPVGSITNGTLVTITSTPPNSTIRYTIDGTDPTTNSTLYTGPFPLDGGKTVKAIATADNWTPSRIYAQFFGWLNFEPVVIQSIAGSGISGTNDAQGLAAQFNGPAGIAVAKDGTLFVVDSGNKSIRKISPNRQVTTFASGFIEPVGVCVDDAANVYVSDDGANQIFRFNPTGDRTLYAGTGALGYDDGPALQATFRYPREMEIDRDGNVYLTDWSNIRKITPAGEVSTFAVGAGTKPGLGLRNKTEVFVMLDEGTLYQITDGVFTAIAGTPQVNVHSDGVGTSAFFYNVFHDIAGDNGGNIIVGDYGVLRRIDTNGQTATLLERPLLPDPNSMKLIAGIAVDTKGNIFVSDSGDNRIKRISPDTDRDGVPDTDETFPLVVGVDDRFVDSDGDGMSNAEEYAAGTDPSVPDGIRVTVEVQNSQLNFSWSTLPGKVYRLQHSDDLKTWLDVDANGPTSQSSTTITPSGSKDFFRVLGE